MLTGTGSATMLLNMNNSVHPNPPVFRMTTQGVGPFYLASKPQMILHQEIKNLSPTHQAGISLSKLTMSELLLCGRLLATSQKRTES